MSRHISLLLIGLLVFLQPFVYGQVINVTTADDFGKLLDENNFVVVKFYTSWCGACKVVEEPFTQLSQENNNKDIAFAEVDIDAVDTLKSKYSISYIPHFIFFKNGTVAKQKLFESLDSFHDDMIKELHSLQAQDEEPNKSPQNALPSEKGYGTRIIEIIMIPIAFLMQLIENIFSAIRNWFV